MNPVPDDELLSAVLDGDATDVDATKVARDPSLAALLEELRAARTAVREPVAPSPEARERAISAALAAWPGEPAGSPSAAAEHPPRDVPAPPAPPAPPPVYLRPSRRRRWLVPAAAAAAVVATAGIVAVASRGGRDATSSEAARSSASAPAEANTGDTAGGAATTLAGAVDASGGGAATTAAGGATTTAGAQTAAPGPTRLGALATPDDVRAAVARLGNGQPGSAGTESSTQANALCPAPVPEAELVGLATWRGDPAFVYRVDTPPARAVVVGAGSCQALIEVPLA